MIIRSYIQPSRFRDLSKGDLFRFWFGQDSALCIHLGLEGRTVHLAVLEHKLQSPRPYFHQLDVSDTLALSYGNSWYIIPNKPELNRSKSQEHMYLSGTLSLGTEGFTLTLLPKVTSVSVDEVFYNLDKLNFTGSAPDKGVVFYSWDIYVPDPALPTVHREKIFSFSESPKVKD